MDISNIRGQSTDWIIKHASSLGVKLSATDVKNLKSMSYDQIAQEVAKLPAQTQVNIVDLVKTTQPTTSGGESTQSGTTGVGTLDDIASNVLMLDLVKNTTSLTPDSLQALATQKGVPDYISRTYRFMVDPRVHQVVLADGGTAYQLDSAYATNPYPPITGDTFSTQA